MAAVDLSLRQNGPSIILSGEISIPSRHGPEIVKSWILSHFSRIR